MQNLSELRKKESSLKVTIDDSKLAAAEGLDAESDPELEEEPR